MNSIVPIERPGSWISLIPQLAFMGLLMYLWSVAAIGNPFINGALTYLVISYGIRALILRKHNAGIASTKKGRFQEAIELFQQSYAFLEEYPWVDTYRYLLLLSSAKISYREMALINSAFCYYQLDNVAQAKTFYEKALRQFPGSDMARNGLDVLNNEINNEVSD